MQQALPEPSAPIAPGEQLTETSVTLLVARAKERDEPAIQELIRRHNQRLFRVARASRSSSAPISSSMR
jgi:hypothetical protein